jgi:hypothetical protein
MSQTTVGKPISLPEQPAAAAPAGRIPPPDAIREPLKVNVFEKMSDAACQLLPLFPYVDAGAMVPCGAVFTGEPDDGEFGHFFHYNTAEEIVVTFGGEDAMMQTGQVLVTQQLHGVNSFLRNPTNPDAFNVMTITQHQAEEGDQREAVLFRCRQCHELLHQLDYDATPKGVEGHDPTQFGGSADDERQPFTTIWGTLNASIGYSEDSVRTCGKCGHINGVHPIGKWGWQRYISQTRAAEKARRAIRSAAETTTQTAEQ